MTISATTPPATEIPSKVPITVSGDPELSLPGDAPTRPAVFADKYEERKYLKHRLAIAFRLSAKFGFSEGVAGHITLRDPVQPDCFWVNPFGLHFSLIEDSDLILVDHSGKVIGGGRNRLLNYDLEPASYQELLNPFCAMLGVLDKNEKDSIKTIDPIPEYSNSSPACVATHGGIAKINVAGVNDSSKYEQEIANDSGVVDDAKDRHVPYNSNDLSCELVNDGDHETNFCYEENADGNIYLHVNEVKKRTRLENSRIVPQLVLKPGTLTTAEQKSIKFFDPGNRYCFWKKDKETHFASHWMDERETAPCHADIKRLQELLIVHPTSRDLDSAKRRKQADGGSETGIICLGISIGQGCQKIQPHAQLYAPKTDKQSVRSCTDDPVTIELIRLFGSVLTQLLKIGLPPALAENIRRRSIADVSFPAGNEDNVFTSNLQANVSLMDEDLKKTIGNGGGAHVDKYDDLGRVNIVLFLPHLPPGYFPGKFLLLNDRTYCVTAPYTALISSGAMPHWPIPPEEYREGSVRYKPAGPIPPPSESLNFRRFTGVGYPQKVATRRAPTSLSQIMKEPESLLVYGTLRNQREYLARLDARDTQTREKDEGNVVDLSEVDRIVQKYSWVESSVTQYPRREIIHEALFGPGGSGAELNARDAFVSNYVHCGCTMPGGTRAGEPALVDEAGKVVSGSKLIPKRGYRKGKKAEVDGEEFPTEENPSEATDKDAKTSKRGQTPVIENDGEGKEPLTSKKARKATDKRF